MYVHSFPHFQLLESHCKQKHEQDFELPYLCLICDEKFILEEALLHHQNVEHSQEMKSFNCDQCQMEFYSKGTKIIHDTAYHDTPTSEIYSCKYCSDVYASVSEILYHHQMYHEFMPLPYFQCGTCEYFSRKMADTSKHVKKEHGIDEYKPYICKHCNFTWDDINNFFRHVRTHYQSNVICNICGKELKPGSLQRHIASVHKVEEDTEKNYVCDLCGYRTDKM